jgi:hypothetical protein
LPGIPDLFFLNEKTGEDCGFKPGKEGAAVTVLSVDFFITVFRSRRNGVENMQSAK